MLYELYIVVRVKCPFEWSAARSRSLNSDQFDTLRATLRTQCTRSVQNDRLSVELSSDCG